MKKLIKFFLLLFVQVISSFALIFIFSFLVYTISKAKIGYSILYIISSGNIDAFAVELSIISTFVLLWFIATRIDANIQLIILCIANCIVHSVSLVVNILNGDWIWPNIVAIICAIFCIIKLRE